MVLSHVLDFYSMGEQGIFFLRRMVSLFLSQLSVLDLSLRLMSVLCFAKMKFKIVTKHGKSLLMLLKNDFGNYFCDVSCHTQEDLI